jgi:hypothetical protein
MKSALDDPGVANALWVLAPCLRYHFPYKDLPPPQITSVLTLLAREELVFPWCIAVVTTFLLIRVSLSATAKP